MTRSAGNTAAKVLPLPTMLSMRSRAWWRCKTCLTMARPRPVPPVARDVRGYACSPVCGEAKFASR